MYHNFADPLPETQEALARHCAHIKRHYEVISMSDIGRALRDNQPLPKNALAVTVDDGYRDFFKNGAPVFEAYKIPVLVYLVSGFLDGKFWFWWDKITYALSQTKLADFQISLTPEHTPLAFSIKTPEERSEAAEAIATAMKKLKMRDWQAIVDDRLPRILKVDLPDAPPPHMAPLRWNEVRQLKAKGFDFGAHTVTHPMLSQLEAPHQLAAEIGGSKRRIEEELGSVVEHFCYPFGRWTDINDDTVRSVEEHKFLTAPTAEFGMNDSGSHRFKLLRLAAKPATPMHYFKEILSGLHC